MQDCVLCIDAATPYMTLALGRLDQGQALGVYVRQDVDRKNSEIIGEAIRELTQIAGISTAQIQGVVCGVGPGTFTGTRVAVATAKGLAVGLKAKLWALDSLSIFAAPHAQKAPGLVVLDARRSELYAAMYGPGDSGIEALTPVQCVPIEKAAQGWPCAPQWIAGTGTSLVAEMMPQLGAELRFEQPMDPHWLWQMGRQCALHSAPVSAATLDVCYLRASYAEIGANTPKTPPYRSPFAPSTPA